MIGYLYAISKGANVIYETKDNVYQIDGLLNFKHIKLNGLYQNCVGDKDELSHFLYRESLSSEKDICKEYAVYDSTEIPLIQQAIIHNDLRNNYDPNTPPLILRPEQYSIFNSKNTMFRYDAFWSLISPKKFDSETSIIIRSYITLRLMREINGRFSYLPPNAYEKNEEPRVLNNQLIEKLKKYLNEWKCNKNDFRKCFIDCIRFMKSKNLLFVYS